MYYAATSDDIGNVNVTNVKSIWLIDSLVEQVFLLINYTVLGIFICFFGSIANAMNMIVLLKQGFRDSINISLFGLAVADGGCLLTQLWVNIGQSSFAANRNIAISPVIYISGSIPYLCFSRISVLITAYISLERCICIALPLKVKTILTLRRTKYIVGSIFVTMVTTTIPSFTTYRLKWRPNSFTNRSVLGLFRTENHLVVEDFLYAFNSVFGYLSIIINIIFTTVLVVILISRARWRHEVTTGNKTTWIPRKESKIVRMVVVLSVVFILCHFPKTLIYFVTIVVPGLVIDSPYHNLIIIVTSTSFSLETLSFGINIFIYLRTSSKYKQIFHSIFYCPFSSCQSEKTTIQGLKELGKGEIR